MRGLINIVKGKQSINMIQFVQDEKKIQQKQVREIPEQWKMKYSHNTLC